MVWAFVYSANFARISARESHRFFGEIFHRPDLPKNLVLDVQNADRTMSLTNDRRWCIDSFFLCLITHWHWQLLRLFFDDERNDHWQVHDYLQVLLVGFLFQLVRNRQQHRLPQLGKKVW